MTNWASPLVLDVIPKDFFLEMLFWGLRRDRTRYSEGSGPLLFNLKIRVRENSLGKASLFFLSTQKEKANRSANIIATVIIIVHLLYTGYHPTVLRDLISYISYPSLWLYHTYTYGYLP